MSLLKLLGIDKYTERLKLWVNNKLDSIKTPDWNAKEDEDGYIENKPFNKEIKQPQTVGDFYYSDDDESWHLDGLGNLSDYIAMVVINSDDNEELNVFKLKNGQTKIFTIPYDNDIMSDVSVHKNDYKYYIDLPNNNASKKYVSNCIKEVFVKYIDDAVIPDSVVKTTPQTLSEDSKNQVKENLGISTPNWNAQPGEPGYIENRTHYVTGTIETINLNGEWDITKNNIIVNDDSIIDISWNIDFMTEHTEGSCRLTGINESKFYSFDNGGFNIDLINNGGSVDLIMNAFGGADPHYGTVTIGVDMGHKTLDEVYIPDTIARKSDIVTPNWNAKEGEVGYIENKPFSKFKVNGEIFDVWQDPYIRNVHYVIPYDPSIIDFEPSKKIDYIRVYWADNDDVVFIDETIKIPNDITSVQTIKYVSMTPLGDFNLDFERTDNEIRIYLTSQSETFSVMAESALNTISVEAITYLSDEYLPDSILKTVPQTLSDADKNQVLANLGIDPVVWKYMCNPYIISAYYGTSDNDLPEELRNIIEDEDGYLTTLALKVLVMVDNDDVTYSINYVTDTTIKSELGLLIYEHGRFYPEP